VSALVTRISVASGALVFRNVNVVAALTPSFTTSVSPSAILLPGTVTITALFAATATALKPALATPSVTTTDVDAVAALGTTTTSPSTPSGPRAGGRPLKLVSEK
jgi:hypothetical protein